MDWLRRIGRTPPGASSPDRSVPGPVERATPGVAALLSGVSEDGSHSVLDLGPAADASLRVYRRFARRVRFADLLSAVAGPEGWSATSSALPPQPERPYDLLFTWDVLDQLGPEQRPRLVERLARLCAPEARLHVIVEASENAASGPLRFTLLDVDRMRCEPSGRARAIRARLLPAEVERLLEPFEVVRAFTLKVGLREYVAVRRGP